MNGLFLRASFYIQVLRDKKVVMQSCAQREDRALMPFADTYRARGTSL